jgi:hypothetical protein
MEEVLFHEYDGAQDFDDIAMNERMLMLPSQNIQNFQGYRQ